MLLFYDDLMRINVPDALVAKGDTCILTVYVMRDMHHKCMVNCQLTASYLPDPKLNQLPTRQF